MHLLIQQVFVKHIFMVRHRTGHWDTTVGKTVTLPVLIALLVGNVVK